jgi:hypothetical protein
MPKRRAPAVFHTTVEVDELARLRSIARREELRPFTDKFSQNLAVLAAYTPREEWPKLFEIAFEAAANEMPHLAYVYTHPDMKA